MRQCAIRRKSLVLVIILATCFAYVGGRFLVGPLLSRASTVRVTSVDSATPHINLAQSLPTHQLLRSRALEREVVTSESSKPRVHSQSLRVRADNDAWAHATPRLDEPSTAADSTNSMGKGYVLRVGSYSQESQADSVGQSIARLGYKVTVTQRGRADKPRFNVSVGPFANQAATREAEAAIKDAGVEAVDAPSDR